MNFSQALQALLTLRFRGSRTETATADPVSLVAEDAPTADAMLAGASFPAQEPALSKEMHLTSQDISGWAMGGSSLSD